MLCKRRDHCVCPLDRVRVRREHLVDDGDLRRVDRHLADEPVAARFLAFALEPSLVAEIDVDSVDRRHPGGGRAGKTKAARKLIGSKEVALRVAVGLGTELGRKVLRTPG
jgi:hypothetical protein